MKSDTVKLRECAYNENCLHVSIERKLKINIISTQFDCYTKIICIQIMKNPCNIFIDRYIISFIHWVGRFDWIQDIENFTLLKIKYLVSCLL